MFEIADNLEVPLTPLTCAIIAQTYAPQIAYVIILRRARNLCWLDWHAPEKRMFERNQNQLGYRICQNAITQAISKAVNEMKE